MARIFGVDLSTHCGYSVLDDGEVLVDSGTLEAPESKKSGSYPWNYLKVARVLAKTIKAKIDEFRPNVVVIEQVNKSRNRFSQQLLDWLHCTLLQELEWAYEVVYLDTSAWRKVLGIKLTKEQRTVNKMPKAKKTKSGIKGKTTLKHLAVEFAEPFCGRKLKQKDNNEAEGVCLAVAYSRGCAVSTPNKQ